METQSQLAKDLCALLCDPLDSSKLHLDKLEILRKVISQQSRRRKGNKRTQRRHRNRRKGESVDDICDEEKNESSPLTPKDFQDQRMLEELDKIKSSASLEGVEFAAFAGLAQVMQKYHTRLQKCREDQFRYRRKRRLEKQVQELQGRIHKLEIEHTALRENLFTLEMQKAQTIAEAHVAVLNINKKMDESQVADYFKLCFQQECHVNADFFPRIRQSKQSREDLLGYTEYVFHACTRVQQSFLSIQPDVQARAIKIIERLILPIDRRFLQLEYPHVFNDEVLVQQVLGKALEVTRTLTLYFDEQDKVHTCVADSNVAAAWTTLLANEALVRFVLGWERDTCPSPE